jgi:hypothetical protein
MKWMVILVAMCSATLMTMPSRALAWNDTGHMTVALIAYRQLDDATRQKVSTILKAHPHYKLYLIENKPEGVSEDEWAFMRASTWSDFIRPARPGSEYELFKGPEITKFHQPYWHYITIPFVPPMERKNLSNAAAPASPASPAAAQPTTATSHPSFTLPLKPAEPNALTAMNDNSKILGTADAKVEDRAVALAWLEHLIGDIHQPLHAASLFSSLYPAGDKGGNSQAIKVDGWVMNLHSFWDGILGNSDGYGAIAFVADEITNDPQLSKDKLPELAKDTSFDSWITESNQYAGSMAYLNGRLRTASQDAWQAKQITIEEVPSLPPSYAINAHDLAKRRAALAGYRMAEEIKRLLAM